MLNYEYPPIGGGTGIACEQLLHVLADDPAVAIELVTSGVRPQHELHRPAGNIRIHRLPLAKHDLQFWRPSELLRWTGAASRHAGRLLDAGVFDLCHCWGGLPAGLLGWRFRHRLPYIVALRGSDVPGYNPRLALLDPLLLRPIARHVWRDAAAIAAVSVSLRDMARVCLPTTPIDVIGNGIDTDRFRPAGGWETTTGPREMNVVFLGRLIGRKRIDILLEAFARLTAARDRTTLTIAGDGPERGRLEAQARALGLGDRVRFTGRLDRGEVAALLSRSAVLVLPAAHDAMPNAVLEAMAAGLAIIATDTSALGLVKGNGVLIPVGDSGAIVRALTAYERDPALLRAHRARSRALAEERSWKTIAAQTLALYRRVRAQTASVTEGIGNQQGAEHGEGYGGERQGKPEQPAT